MAFNPYFYNDSPLPMELIYKALTELGDVVPTVAELKVKVDKLIADLDGAIKDEVQCVINEMYESGELAQVIAQTIANSMTGKTGDFDLAHMAYILHAAHSYGRNELPPEDAALTINEEYYNALQGNCVFDIDGNLFWACCYVCQNGSDKENNNACRIYVYTINQDGSLNYVTDKEFAVMGHCNSMTYLNGYLYICPNSYLGTGGGSTTDVHRIAFDGETLGGTIDPDTQKYRAETQTPARGFIVAPGYTDYIMTFNNKLYLCDRIMNVYSYDWDSNSVQIEYHTINGTDYNPGGDGASMSEDYIYIGASGYRIKRYNKNLGYIDWVYQLPYKPNNRAFKLGEVEGFTVRNGVLYLAGFYNLNSESTRSNTYSITHFYRQNLATNNIRIPNFVNWSNGYVRANAIFAVEGNIPGDRDNPRSDYFSVPCAQVAIDFIESNDYIERGIVSVRQYRNLSTIDIRTTKPITIDGTYYRNNVSRGTSPSIGHIYCWSNSNLYLVNIIVDNRLPLDINNVNITDNCICNLGGNMSVQNCAFPTGLNTNAINVKYAIKAYHGTLNARSDADYSTSPESWVKNRTTRGVKNPAFTAGSDIIRNINQTVTGN